ncbi:MAG TPA: hypothetical protein VFA61_04860 [Candidatus Udaeobacter sp.]|nr:hypothetical protein [Candidatus Udaeobacter sp.]
MPRFLFIATFAFVLLVKTDAKAGERDYLQPGVEKLRDQQEIKYDQAIRDVLSRAWRTDVVLRMVDIPPFQAEWVTGIAHFGDQYVAFEVTASKHIWSVLGFGGGKKGDYHTVHPVIREHRISASVSARIAALWRRVLQDSCNYGKDPAMYLDTDQFTYYLSFIPRERLTAHTTGWGPKTEQLNDVAFALANHAEGAPEGELVKAVEKAERKLGILTRR